MSLRRILDSTLVTIALGIAVFMLAPPTSPVLGSSSGVFSIFGSDGHPADEAEAEPAAVAWPTPEPAPTRKRPPPTRVKGFLMTGYTAGGSRFETLLDLIDRTELNTVVIDIKDEAGEVSWLPRAPALQAYGGGVRKIRDPAATIKRLKANDVYVIGRIVAFQDPRLVEARPDLGVQSAHGGVWTTEKGLGWTDPYSPEVRAYNIELATEAIALGFDEIQYDYVRFPSDGDVDVIWFPHRDHRHPTEVIRSFLAEARREIVGRGAYISADLFGLVTLAKDDMGIGQRLELVAQEVDYVSLMLYPSHYHKPEYDIPDPEREPYRTIDVSIKDAKRRIAGTNAKLRPWIQDFSLRVRYGEAEVRAQIRALRDNGVTEFLLWNAANRYTESALAPA